MPQTTEPTPGAFSREPRVLLEDLTSGLLWPKLLRAAGLSLRPERLVMGTAAWIVILAIGSLNELWSDKPGFIGVVVDAKLRALAQLWEAILSGNPQFLAATMAELAALPGRLLDQYPISFFLLGIPIIVVWVLFGGAISRSAAVEFSSGRVIGWERAAGLAVRKWLSLLGAVLAPLAIVVAIAVALAIGGLLFAVPFVHLAPAALYFIALILGAIAVVVLVLWSVARPMLVPGVACEGTDALDAIQRAFAYVFARPGRLVLYMLILALQGLIVIGLFSVIVSSITAFTAASTGAFIGDKPREIIVGGSAGGEPMTFDELIEQTREQAERAGDDAGTDDAVADENAPAKPLVTRKWARWLVSLWTGALELLVGGLMISFYFTAGTVLYLVMRQLCDGQDVAELWTPSGES
ncbi:MAG: hypothetical protein R3B57_04865 [Phycisphaerales bacterium]